MDERELMRGAFVTNGDRLFEVVDTAGLYVFLEDASSLVVSSWLVERVASSFALVRAAPALEAAPA